MSLSIIRRSVACAALLALAAASSGSAAAQTETNGTGEQASKQLSTPPQTSTQVPAEQQAAPMGQHGTDPSKRPRARSTSPSALQPDKAPGGQGLGKGG